jgi:hypothetical protein
MRSTLTAVSGSMLCAMFSGRHAAALGMILLPQTSLCQDKEGHHFVDPDIFRYLLQYLRSGNISPIVADPDFTRREMIIDEFDYFCTPFLPHPPQRTRKAAAIPTPKYFQGPFFLNYLFVETEGGVAVWSLETLAHTVFRLPKGTSFTDSGFGVSVDDHFFFTAILLDSGVTVITWN